ncbi:MAG TPA: DUF881 domain-containing protein [Capsulimonadaceae bacterium]|jgi:uncharacterized protein YlxW (UPF0749 family)
MSVTVTTNEQPVPDNAPDAATAPYGIAPPVAEAATPQARAERVWVWPITAMTFILGMFIALAMKSEKLVFVRDAPASNVSGVVAAYQALKVTESRDRLRIEELQNQNAKLMNSSSSVSGLFQKQLTEAQFLAGVTKVTGPGVVVTLTDSNKRPPANLPGALATDLTNMYIVHDVDIQRVLNELRAGGAESLAVNDQRVVATTAVRCVGPAIQVNGVPLTPPFRITAIGDAKSLNTTLLLPGGLGEQIKSADPAMLTVVQSPKLTLPAYAGFQPHYAKPVVDGGSKSAD